MHYLDNSATTQVCPEAAQAALSAMTEEFGNPSSTHTVGREAKKLLDRSRISVASALGCAPGELIFTSCGSESDNWALLSGAESMKRKGKHIISSIAEHDAIRRSLDLLEERGFEVTRLKPGKDGAVSVDAVRAALLSENPRGRSDQRQRPQNSRAERNRCAVCPQGSPYEADDRRRQPGRRSPCRH